MFRLALRGIAQRKLRAALTAVAVLLGVAMISGTLVFSDTLNRAFREIFTEASKNSDAVVSAKTDFDSQSGFPPSISERLVTQISALPATAKVQGQVADLASIVGKDGKIVETGGAPTLAFSFSPPPFDALRVVSGRSPRVSGEVVIDKDTASSERLRLGDRVQIVTDRPARYFRLVGTVAFGNGSLGGATIVAFQFEQAQELFDKQGKVDQISVAAKDDASARELVAQIDGILPAGVQVRTGQDQADEDSKSIEEDLSFITYLLLGFAFVAVFVGAFIIFNTFSITVAQRRKEFALLRLLGAFRRQILLAVFAEALLIGTVASVVGLFAGLGLAKVVSALFKAFGADLPTTSLVFASRTVVVCLTVGLLVTLVSALLPALKATRVAPLEALRESILDGPSRKRRRVTFALALLVLVVGIAMTVAGLLGDFAGTGARLQIAAGGAVVATVGMALFSPRLVPVLARVVGWPLERIGGLTGRVARGNAVRNPSRTAVTASALMVGLSVVLFVTILAQGLSESIDRVVDRTLASDFTVYSNDGFTQISPSVTDVVAGVPQVAVASPLKSDSSRLNDKASSVQAFGIDTETIGEVYRFDWISGGSEVLNELGGDGALLEEGTAEALEAKVGDRFTAKSPGGRVVTFNVRGIYKDDGILPGYVLPVKSFDRLFGQRKLQLVFAKLKEGVDADGAQRDLSGALAGFPNVKVRSQRDLKEENAKQLDQLLGFIYSLLFMSILIALFGIVNTLTLSIYERTRELGLLRALGMSKRQLRRLVRYESVITAAIGAVFGLLLGLFFAAVVTRALVDEGVVFAFPVARSAALVALAVVAGVLAAVIPARRAARLNVLEAISYE